ncbi:MAG: ImmA/IrrE family metallo-endopeptidase [Pyrinomonadaceae bacterium]|nr:ImmA/IrrE family metallo-endopeptidase [Pyrinomonadaceae bacterium]
MPQPRNEAIVKPEILVWAREDAGYHLEEAAKKISITPKKLLACESGQARLTINQLRGLSNVYKRPLAFFYLPTPPKTTIDIKDFRHFSDETDHSLSPALRYEVRKAKSRRELALSMYEDLEITPETFNSRTSLDESVAVVGQRVRDLLQISFERQVRIKSDYEALRFWRDAIEARGVLVFQASISKREMRGFSIWDAPLPISVVNTKDSPYGRVFTMVHELTHLMLRSGGLCDLGENNIEVFCNAVAGETLVPSEFLLQERIIRDDRTNHIWSDESLLAIANRYSVSRVVVLRRLLTLGKTTQEFYRLKTGEWKKAFELHNAKESSSGGIVLPHVKALSVAGKTFVRLVLDSYHQEKISSIDAAQYLGVKVKYLSEIEKAVTIPYLTGETA